MKGRHLAGMLPANDTLILIESAYELVGFYPVIPDVVW